MPGSRQEPTNSHLPMTMDARQFWDMRSQGRKNCLLTPDTSMLHASIRPTVRHLSWVLAAHRHTATYGATESRLLRTAGSCPALISLQPRILTAALKRSSLTSALTTPPLRLSLDRIPVFVRVISFSSV